MHLLDTVLAFIAQHPGMTYAVVFLASLAESLAIVGLLFPGTMMLFGIGAVVSTGSLHLSPVLLLAMAGAVAGDSISYWLGRHYQERLERLWPFSRHPAMLQKGTAFFRRHGGKSILFGRFVGPVRAVVPVVAGMLGMGPVRFAVVNVVSAVGWSLVYILPGVFFGVSLMMAGAVSTRLAVLVFIFVLGCLAFVWLCREAGAFVVRRSPGWMAALQRWAGEREEKPAFLRPLKRLFHWLLFRRQGEELLFVFLLLALLAATWGTLGVLQDILAKDPLVVADRAVYHFLQTLRTSWGDIFFVALTELGDSTVNIALLLTLLLVLVVRRCRHAALFLAISVLGGQLIVQLLKWSIHSPRPIELYHGASSFGFPSGHAAMSVVLSGSLAVLMVRGLVGHRRWWLFSAVMLISFVIGFSRLYLGAHWLSDVVGGFLVGLSWVLLLGIIYLGRHEEAIPRRLLGVCAVLAVLFAGGWHISRNLATDLDRYAPREKLQHISAASWLSGGWRSLPSYRIDLAGELEQPLDLQWTGEPERLEQYLLSQGWRRPPQWNLQNLLQMLFPEAAVEELPVLPLLHDGHKDALRLVRPVGKQRWVLRLWPTEVRVDDAGGTLFVGTIEVQKRQQLADLVFLARDVREYRLPLEHLETLLAARFEVNRGFRGKEAVEREQQVRRGGWQGKVLLVGQQ